jgi:hypothetical protein
MVRGLFVVRARILVEERLMPTEFIRKMVGSSSQCSPKKPTLLGLTVDHLAESAGDVKLRELRKLLFSLYFLPFLNL